MDEKKAQILSEIGVDIPAAMERFMNNEEMYWHFLLKLTTNTQFDELEQAIAKEEWGDALTISHNLKGFTGNLALRELYSLLSFQVNKFREEDWNSAIVIMEDIRREYERVLGLIQDAE